MATNNEILEKLDAIAGKLEEKAPVEETGATVKDYFSILNPTNVNEHTEKKNGLTYLSWAWAWAKIKAVCPDATYTIYERETDFGPCNYFTDGNTCWVKTGVTLGDLEYIEELPVMDFKNKSIPLAAITSMDVNKAIQRSLTKACARHGLGLYIYAGEDLPEESEEEKSARAAKEQAALREASEIARLQNEIDKLIRQQLASMTPEQKKAFASDKVIPVLGTANYKACRDIEKLTALLSSLAAENAA